MDLDKIAIYVDGDTEKGALEVWFYKNYQSTAQFRYGPGNGVCYAISGYAKNIAPKVVQNLKTTIRHIIFVPDFEKRQQKLNITFENFINELKTGIVNECLNCSNYSKEYLEEVLHVCPSNIMFENWIVCDIDGIKSNPDIIIDGASENYDGRNGCAILSSMMKIKYKKTVHAKKLYKYVEPQRGIKYSDSYGLFCSTIDSLIMRP